VKTHTDRLEIHCLATSRTNEAKIPVLVARYEDLRIDAAPTLEKVVAFLLPSQHRPSLQQITLALADDSSQDPYFSRKSACFSAWNHFDEEARTWIMENVKEEW